MMPGIGNRESGISDGLDQQRKAVGRAVAQGRRWYLRAVLMVVIGIFAAWRGGQLNYALGVVLVLLAGLSWSLGRSMRRSAAASLAKIELMEKTGIGNRESGIAGGGA